MELLPLVVIFALMYFLLIRPQQKRVREQQETVRSLEVGDEILTTAGVYGTVTLIDGEVMLVEVAEGLEVRMAKTAVSQLVTYDDEDEVEDADTASDD